MTCMDAVGKTKIQQKQPCKHASPEIFHHRDVHGNYLTLRQQICLHGIQKLCPEFMKSTRQQTKKHIPRGKLTWTLKTTGLQRKTIF